MRNPISGEAASGTGAAVAAALDKRDDTASDSRNGTTRRATAEALVASAGHEERQDRSCTASSGRGDPDGRHDAGAEARPRRERRRRRGARRGRGSRARGAQPGITPTYRNGPSGGAGHLASRREWKYPRAPRPLAPPTPLNGQCKRNARYARPFAPSFRPPPPAPTKLKHVTHPPPPGPRTCPPSQRAEGIGADPQVSASVLRAAGDPARAAPPSGRPPRPSTPPAFPTGPPPVLATMTNELLASVTLALATLSRPTAGPA